MKTLCRAFLLLALLPTRAHAFDHEHQHWTDLLRAHASQGRVDYKGFPRAGLEAYLGGIEAVTAAEYDGFTRDQKLAFWINAYNAYTVKLVLDHHPVQSIRDIGSLFRSVFKIEFIPLTKLRGGTLSLDTVEHRILREEFDEPRIHAAIVCASVSCPALRAEAYRASQLAHQLDDAMRSFIRDPGRNRWDGAARTLYLSSIFKWFREDFEGAAGSLLGFVLPYLDEKTAEEVRHADRPRLSFLDYDWSLNGE